MNKIQLKISLYLKIFLTISFFTCFWGGLHSFWVICQGDISILLCGIISMMKQNMHKNYAYKNNIKIWISWQSNTKTHTFIFSIGTGFSSVCLVSVFRGGWRNFCQFYWWHVTELIELLEYHRTTKNHNSYIKITITWLTFLFVSFLFLSFLIRFGRTLCQ